MTDEVDREMVRIKMRHYASQEWCHAELELLRDVMKHKQMCYDPNCQVTFARVIGLAEQVMRQREAVAEAMQQLNEEITTQLRRYAR